MEYTIHVLYLNDGRAFDTNSSRQFPIEEIHDIYKAKVYKVFSFEEIATKSYIEFKKAQEEQLAKWASENNCSMYKKFNV